MNYIDYIIFAILAISMIMGFIKGLIKQLLTVGGIIVVALLTATFTPFVQGWLDGIMSQETGAAVAMFATVILLSVVYSLLAWLLRKLLNRIHIIKILDKVFGGVMGIVVVYLVFAVIFGVFTMTGDGFLPLLKSGLQEGFQNSWFGQNIYTLKGNFFGKWVIEGIAEKLIQNLQPAEALLGF